MFLPDVSDLYEKYMVTKNNRKCLMLRATIAFIGKSRSSPALVEIVSYTQGFTTMARLLLLWETKAVAGISTLVH
tara:strand:+ start:585 stop:809 length:225 start_codon:yes stop_codon:yes gene_type:complete